jgi:hypothetical protein
MGIKLAAEMETNRGHQHKVRRTPTQSTTMPSRLAALSAISLVVLTLLSFIFTIVSLTSTHWTTQAQYSYDLAHPNRDNRTYTGDDRRGPFGQWTIFENATDPTGPWIQVFERGRCSVDDDDWWCQQFTVATNLLITGCVFAGLAFLAAMFWGLLLFVRARKSSAAAAAATAEDPAGGEEGGVEQQRRRRRRWRHAAWPSRARADAERERHWWFSIARGSLRLLLVLALIAFASGSLVATYLLADKQRGDGDFDVSRPPPPIGNDHWRLSDGVVFANLGWLPNLIAVLCLPANDVLAASYLTARRGPREGAPDCAAAEEKPVL